MGALEDSQSQNVADADSTTGVAIPENPQQVGDAGEPVPRPGDSAGGEIRRWIVSGILFVLFLLIALPPLFSWQMENQQKALSLANMRRIANGCLIYAQDWDYRLPPPYERLRDGNDINWPRRVRPYVSPDDVFSNPSNPVKPFASALRDPVTRRRLDTSYALNHRFWNTFSAGPFPLENLEIPERTAFIMEAGRMTTDARRPHIPAIDVPGIGTEVYGDTTNKVGTLWAYPSVHGDKMDVVAADGHGIVTRVSYYVPADGPHDTLFGRIGETIYNWNGGHPNGQTDTPPRE